MGWQADQVEGELAPGSTLALGWPALGVALELDVVELAFAERVVLARGATRVEITLHDAGVELTHTGVGDGDERDGVRSSWQLSLGLLMHYCEAHADAARTVRWLVRPARTTTDAAHVFFSDQAALATWLGSGSAIGAAGSRYSLDLGGGERMSGRVLANTPSRDLALSWEEDDESALVLRTLPRPFDPGVRLVVLSYSRWARRTPPQSRLDLLEAAHHRLVRLLDSDKSA
jgi:uncharacterized protein YndB with AHSA1/START domain